MQTEKDNKIDTIITEPKLFAVMMHNDDFTPMDFVVHILVKVFRKDAEKAEIIMLDVHNTGIGVAGVFPFDIAITKKIQSEQMANEKGYPLRLTLSEAESNEI